VGLRVWLRGALPPGRRRTGHVELYDAGRFFTVTGRPLAGTPSTIEARPEALAALHADLFPPVSASPVPGRPEPPDLDDEAIIDVILRSRAGARFARLWDGEWEALGYASHSEADLALCSLIAFFTGSDAARVDHLFRRSRLYREKWDAARGDRTYGARTLGRAVARR
jgi:putative DNA primase/helicase